ncbi:MAG: macro domain-containing protein [Erysipelotrichaceae bacterium]|nr:macro domain-containing protein [Erysipelotrichaceae bacterium]
MAIKFVRADITTIKADAIVNSANPRPVVGGGVDSAIYNAAGREDLLEQRKKIGSIDRGQARITWSKKLNCHIIHTVGPKWIDGNHGEFDTLRDCYRNSLNLAYKYRCKSIVFPLISAGVYGFPKQEALKIALDTINEFLFRNTLDVTLCVFDEQSFVLSGKIADVVEELITRKESEDKLKEEYNAYFDLVKQRTQKANDYKPGHKQTYSYRNELSHINLSFGEMLRRYIDSLGLKASEIYKTAGIPKQSFSRMLWDVNIPKKHSVIMICIAMKLNLEQTIDMLSRASCSFNPASEADKCIMNCIKEGVHDLNSINQALAKLNLDYQL